MQSIIKSKRYLFSFWIIVFSLNAGYAQLLVDKVIPPSPDAAALMKYCDHPIGRKTGTPRIEIPLHTIRYNDIRVPISLNYHPSGVKVEEEATWVGLGWRLNAGGVITRLVRGKNDFQIIEDFSVGEAKGFPFENIQPCSDDCPERAQEQFADEVCSGHIDTDPDVFFFDVLGAKGKFLLTPDHSTDIDKLTVELVSPRNMTAVFDMKNNAWEVKDARGYTYRFNTREITETQRNYFDYKFKSERILFKFYSDLATTAWYLDEVVSPTGSTMTFIYDTDDNGKSFYATNGANSRMNINDRDMWDVHYTSYCFPDTIENVQMVAENFYNNIYLTEIVYGGSSVSFYKSDRKDMVPPVRSEMDKQKGSAFSIYLYADKPPQKLDEIVVNEGSRQKNIKFNYEYFNPDADGKDERLIQRLKLNSLVTNTNGNEGEYKFDYFQEFPMPSKESHARDFWGYHNGEEDIHNIVPSDFFNYNMPERLFESDHQHHYSQAHVKEGILISIEYPEGFTQSFEYEPHEYSDVSEEIVENFEGEGDAEVTDKHKKSNDAFLSGGLRVTRIVNALPTDKLYTEYQYKTKGGNVLGILSVTPFSHEAEEVIGHKPAGNHYVLYEDVKIFSGKIFK